MDAVTERDGLWTVEHEPVGIGERFAISVCRSENQQKGVARPDGLLTERDVLAGLPPDELIGTHQAHELLDRRWPARGVLRQLCPDIGKREEHRCAVSDQARRILV